jgi:hypothetical protein
MKQVLIGLQGILVGVRLLPSLHEYPGSMLDSCVPLRSQVREVGSWFLGPVALQWLRGLGQLG